ncbi:MAG: glutamate-5-semialdehyde dehydrogenase [Desulfobacterales bacterium]|nr:glutamate-5-semialdehyde dehydrogenase [Deltaproteobacteria bacterium]NNK95793.1 glutamate-5-semialdehyde dehydrogenase [Desulfobacterales bacterium]
MNQAASYEKVIEEMAERAKHASRSLANLSSDKKNTILHQVAEILSERKSAIQAENTKDLQAGKMNGLSEAMLDRLALTDMVIQSMRDGLFEVMNLPDPIGQVTEMVKRPNDLLVGRMRVPLGVIGMIYESRPNVTIDAAALCLKTGNSVILRGGSEAIYSNLALASVLQDALSKVGVDPDAVQVVPITDRGAVTSLLNQESAIDLIIPRGGEGLIRFVAENSRIPVLKHYKGVCHIYVDQDADLKKATPIIINSKVQRPGVCNALEGLLIHRHLAGTYLPEIADALDQAGVTMVGCSVAVTKSSLIHPAAESDWGTEFLDLKICIKVVESAQEAKDYIDRYGSQHTESIITENYSAAKDFIETVDASAVMVNSSTRFNDGGQLGLGTEIGISTTKLHAYGPMGLEELTTRKFVVYGTGQVRD